MGKATNYKLGRYIHRVHASKSPLKIWENRERGRIQGLPKFLKYPPIISGMGKATKVKFGRYIQRIHPNKSQLKIWEKMERRCIQGLPKFFEYLILLRVELRRLTFELLGRMGCVTQPDPGGTDELTLPKKQPW